MGVKVTPALVRIAAKLEHRGDCRVWLGRHLNGEPMCDIEGGVQRKVRTVLFEHETGQKVQRRVPVRMRCTTASCVAIAHMENVNCTTVAAAPAPESRLPRHLKFTTAVRSVWELAAAA